MQSNIFENINTVSGVLGVLCTLLITAIVFLFNKYEKSKKSNFKELTDLLNIHKEEIKVKDITIDSLQKELVENFKESVETIIKLTTLIESLPKQEKMTENFNNVMLALVELKSTLKEYINKLEK